MRNVVQRNELVQEYMSLAIRMANTRHRSVNCSVQLDELVSAAYVGLIDAAEKYDASKANEKALCPFAAYARTRIAGEMNDYLRSCNWGGRNSPQRMFSLDAKLSHTKNENLDQTDFLYDNVKPVTDNLNSKEIFEKIIKCLPKMVKNIFRLRYINDLTMKEVAETLQISESRVSQIISQHSVFLRNTLQDKQIELWNEVVSNHQISRYTQSSRL